MQLKSIFKDHDKERLREQIRREVEARKAAESAEREARKKAAEERRKAVVERIRKQQELEEQRKRDAETARIRILEEQARKEQEERDRLLADQTAMTMEDQLSTLAEQDFREYLERKEWQQRERERLLEWEREQKRKDELEEEKRKQRMTELEEKKKKLDLLRQQQQQTQTASSAATALAMKEEGDRINKQLRIQNRAKFVSKKISNISPVPVVMAEKNKVATPRETDSDLPLTSSIRTSEMTPPAPATLSSQMTKMVSKKDLVEIFSNSAALSGLKGSSSSIFPSTLAEGKMQSALGTTGATRIPSIDPAEIQKFKANIQDISSDTQLKEMQKDLMQQKRGLRLEQRQKASFLMDNQVNNNSEDDFNLQQKLLDIDTKHDLIEKRLTQLVANVTEAVAQQNNHVESPSPRALELLDVKRPASGGSKSNSAQIMSRGKSFKDNYNKNQKIQLSKSVEQEKDTCPVSSTTFSQSASTTPDYTNLFNKIEAFLRNCNKLLVSFGFDDSTNALNSNVNSSTQSLHSSNPLSSLTLHILETNQLIKELNKDYDPLGYRDKLNDMSNRLKCKVEEIEGKQKEEELRRSKVRLSPRRETSSNSIKPITPRPNTALPLWEAETPQQQLSFSVSTPALPAESSPPESRVSSFHESSLLPDKSMISRVEELNVDVTIVEDVIDEQGIEDNIPNPETIPGWEDCIYTSMFSAAHHAAYFGFTDVLKFLVKFFDCFIMDNKGRTPLFYASLANRLDCVAILLELGPDWIDVGDEKGDTPLHAAAISNSVQILAFLLSCEAHPDTANSLGKTPSHLARSEESLKLLCDAGATLYCIDNSNHMPLWYACAENRVDCVKFLCQRTPKEFLLWQDDEGDSCLHKAAAAGQGNVVELLCQHITKIEDLYIVNKRSYTAAHVASNASVLKALYENGANLWIPDSKQHMPLFLASFHGRPDCVAFLLDIGTKSSATYSSSGPSSRSRPQSATRSGNFQNFNVHEGILARDKQGDTALHVASVCGHISCVSLLLYYIRNDKNNQQLTPSLLAKRAGHIHIYQLIEYYENYRINHPHLSMQEIFQTDFSTLSSIILYYGSRWSLGYDSQFATIYYLDYCTGASQWNKPESFDVPPKEESKYLKALDILIKFYEKYNPEKVKDTHSILSAFQGRYTELFINLANRYNVQDLSMFQGIDFDQ